MKSQTDTQTDTQMDAQIDAQMDAGADTGLKRVLSLPLLVLYGLGTTIGAGIFVLTGKVAGVAGGFAPLAFLSAAILAGLAALCFAELAVRHPESGGAAVYVKEGLGSDRLALLTGGLVILAGLVSTATIITGFAGYAGDMVPAPALALKLGAAVLLGLIAFWGVQESVTVAATVTIAEVGVLIAICLFGLPGLTLDGIGKAMQPATADAVIWAGVASGALLAFYAFIGFEDIVNVAEETRDPHRTLPRAIIVTLVVTSILYVAVSLIAVTAAPLNELAGSTAPLTFLFERVSGLPGGTISIIAIFSVLNGALIQIIMASRVFFGLGRRGWLPAWLATVHRTTRTPSNAIILCVLIVALLVTAFPLEALAKTTSFITLAIFALVAVALFRLKRKTQAVPAGGFSVPIWLPVATVAAIAALVIAELYNRLG